MLDHDYNDWGSCPAEGDPLEVELEDGHVLEIVVVDPGALLCDGQDDPMVVALPARCARLSGDQLGARISLDRRLTSDQPPLMTSVHLVGSGRG